MAGFSLNDAWNEGVAFVRNNLRTVVIWAALGVVIPGVLQLAILGGVAEQQAMIQRMVTGAESPAALLAAMGGGVILIGIISAVLSTASYFGAWRMGLVRGTIAVPQAVIYALGAALLTLLVFILLGIVLVIVLAIPLGMLGAMGVLGSGGDPSPGGILAAAGIGLLLMLLVIPLTLWLSARLSVFGPVMAAAGSMNPLYGMAQSWRLTKPAQWAILGYLLLLFIALMVVSMVIALISGVGMIVSSGLQSGGEIGTGSLVFSTLLGMVVSIPLTVAYIGVPAGIYRALSPDPVADVFE